MITNTFLLFAADHETTTKLLGNRLWVVLATAQWDYLRHHPALLEYAIEEILRFNSPVQTARRHIKADIELACQQVRAGKRFR